MLWKSLDHYKEEMAQSGDANATAKEVRLSEMLSHNELVDTLEGMPVRYIPEYALNTVHEHAVVVYTSHTTTTMTGL